MRKADKTLFIVGMGTPSCCAARRRSIQAQTPACTLYLSRRRPPAQRVRSSAPSRKSIVLRGIP